MNNRPGYVILSADTDGELSRVTAQRLLRFATVLGRTGSMGGIAAYRASPS